MKIEDLIIHCTASFRKYFDAAGVGIPIRYLQQGPDDDAKLEDEVQLISEFEFPPRGGRNEDYLLFTVRALVKTRQVPSDVYYHTRVKARVADILSRHVPVLLIGKPSSTTTQIGVLRPMPRDVLLLVPAAIEPMASSVESTFEFQPC